MDSTEAPSRIANIDFARFRLRDFVESLTDGGELEIRSEATDLADVAAALYCNPNAVHFQKTGAEGAELVGNVNASRSRLARAFGVGKQEILAEILRRLKNSPEIIEVSRGAAPVQEIVLMGDDADLTRLPIHLQHGADGGPYISASIDYSIDQATGFTNIGMRRMMLRGAHEAGVDLNAPSDLRAIYQAAVARGEKLPVSFVVGAHPIDHVAATMRLAGDELELLATLRGAPLPVVKCVTNDIRVPADAEWVIEGYLDEKGYVEQEGPYGEYLGYYGGVKLNPVFHVTAITRRRDALFQTVTISGKQLLRTDTSQLETLRTELNVWRALTSVVREPIAVYAPVAAGGSSNVRVALRQRFPGEARTAIYTVLSTVGVKNMFVVDPDIDIFSDEQMEWALGTRFQGDRDLILLTGVRASPLDPSLHGAATGAKVGYDLTWPYGGASRMEMSIPEPPRYEGKRFASIPAALADGPKSFEQLMAAVGSRDGREIVREIEKLYRAPGLTRDEQGRYVVKSG
ncbi:MAG: UbiD family decarboxylase [Rhodospirillales bacterium]|nr:UbiD family decarboxylase [Rhodospirillales bacterium]